MVSSTKPRTTLCQWCVDWRVSKLSVYKVSEWLKASEKDVSLGTMVIEGVPLLAMAATTGHCPFYANGVLKPLPGNIMEGILLQAKKNYRDISRTELGYFTRQVIDSTNWITPSRDPLPSTHLPTLRMERGRRSSRRRRRRKKMKKNSKVRHGYAFLSATYTVRLTGCWRSVNCKIEELNQKLLLTKWQENLLGVNTKSFIRNHFRLLWSFKT